MNASSRFITTIISTEVIIITADRSVDTTS
jgi:hypothetical protein